MKETLRKLGLYGVGLAALAEEKIDKLLNEAVEEGRITKDESKAAVEELKFNIKKEFKKAVWDEFSRPDEYTRKPFKTVRPKGSLKKIKTSKYRTLASKKSLERTIGALTSREIKVELLDSSTLALKRIEEIIPPKASVMTGGSETLKEIGLVDLLKSGNHPWINFKKKVLAEKDPVKQNELRKKSCLVDYYLGSVHGIAETGELVFASASGSQLSPYSFTCDNVIWVAGTQKIEPTLEDAIARVIDYALPLEDERMKSEGYPGSIIGKLLIFEREINPHRNLTLLLVKERLGF